jgi:hypothetical protein
VRLDVQQLDLASVINATIETIRPQLAGQEHSAACETGSVGWAHDR